MSAEEWLLCPVCKSETRIMVREDTVLHGAALLRQAMMEMPMAATFAGAPAETVRDFKLMMGVEYSFNGMLATAVVFYALSVWNLSRKKK